MATTPIPTIKFKWTSESTWCHLDTGTWYIASVLGPLGTGLPAPSVPRLGVLQIIWADHPELRVPIYNLEATEQTWRDACLLVAGAAVCPARELPLVVNAHGDNYESIRAIARRRIKDRILL